MQTTADFFVPKHLEHLTADQVVITQIAGFSVAIPNDAAPAEQRAEFRRLAEIVRANRGWSVARVNREIEGLVRDYLGVPRGEKPTVAQWIEAAWIAADASPC